jgi:hypothetical protein
LPWRIVADVLRVSALEIGHPIPGIVLVKRRNFARDGHRCSS